MHILNTLPQRLDSGATPTFTGALFTDNVTAPDLILGTSGPSAKSSIAARAARQGLVGDGTAGSTFTSAAIGASDFTVAAWVKPTTLTGSNRVIVDNAGSLAFYINASGTIVVLDRQSATVIYQSAAGVIVAGKSYFLAYVRGKMFVDGIQIGTFTDTSSYTGTSYRIGWAVSNDSYFIGFLSTLLYNRALSAAEVVSLYEAGVPAGADYNTASNTSKLTGANSDFSSAGNWTITGATTISGGKLNLSNNDQAYCTPGNISVPVGGKFRVTLTVDSITAGSVQVYTGSIGGWVNIATTAGTFTQEFTFSAATGSNTTFNLKSTGGNAVVDTALYYQIGLLLAPDAAQSGGGLTWYDTSGNAANITLPATGVTWNVPTSGRGIFADGTAAAPSISFSSAPTNGIYYAGGNEVGISNNGILRWKSTYASATNHRFQANGGGYLDATSNGAIGLTAAGTNQNITLTPSGTGLLQFNGGSGGQNVAFNKSSGNNFYFSVVSSVDESLRFQNSSGTNLIHFDKNGRVLIGTTTDSGALLQIGTNSTSNAGGIVFGTDTFAFRSAAGRLSLYGSAGSGLRIESLNYLAGLLHSGNTPGTIADAPHLCIQSPGGSVYVASSGTLALTLDSSQNATFAGTVKSSVSTGSRTIQSTPTVTVAPDAVQNLVSQNYGFFLVNENVLTGSIAIIGFNSGGTYIVWQEGTNYSTTANTASKFNVYYSAGTQLVVQNKKASNATFNIINLAGGS